MFGQGKSVTLSKSASGGQEPFVKVDVEPEFKKELYSNTSASRIWKGSRPMHTSTLVFSDNNLWNPEHTSHDNAFSHLNVINTHPRQPEFSYSDEIKRLGWDEYHRFDPTYSEHFCKGKPLKTASALKVNRLSIGAKQMDSVGVKGVMRQRDPVYTTQYGKTHAYLGLLKTLEPIPQRKPAEIFGYPKSAVCDPITGDEMRKDLVPSRGFKKASAAKMIEIEDNKFKGLRSITNDGIC